MISNSYNRVLRYYTLPRQRPPFIYNGPLNKMALLKELIKRKLPVRVKDIEYTEPIIRRSSLWVYLHDIVTPDKAIDNGNSYGFYLGEHQCYVKFYKGTSQLMVTVPEGNHRVYVPGYFKDGKPIEKDNR